MNVLIIRVSAIGDVIHTLPSILLLKQSHPSARISWIVQEKAASLLKNQPFIDNLWVIPNKFLRPENWTKTYSLLKEIKRIHWDAILDFQGIFKTSLLLSFLRGKKYGFSFDHARSSITALLTHKQVSPVYTNIIQKNLALASFVAQDLFKIQASPTLKSLQTKDFLSISNEKKQLVDSWLTKNNLTKFLIIAPNTTWPSKHLPEEHWRDFLLKTTSHKLNLEKNISFLLVGKEFGEQALNLSRFIETEGLNVFVAPSWDLLTTAYLIKKAQLIIAPDTGLLHLADFLGTKSIGIFGPTQALKSGPFLSEQNKKNAIQVPCPHSQQKTHGPYSEQNCMYKLSPEQLYTKVKENL